jgi:HK97 family phage major capsid protein
MTLPEMREDKGRLAKQANDILEAARADGRHDLKKDEEEKFDAIHADIDKLSASIAREERQAATMASLESGGRRSEPNPIEQRGTSGRTSDGKITEYDREEAFRAWALAGSDCELTERQQKNAQRCGVNLASKKMKLNLFAPVALKASNLKNPTEDDIRAWHRQMDEKRAGLRQDETRAALTGAQSTTTTGGYTVADAAMRALEVALLQFGGVRSVATIIRTDTGGPLPMPTTNDTANKGARLAENTTATELEMTFSQVVLDAFKYSSKYLLASVEFLQDSSINVSEFIGNALGNRIGRIQNDEFTTGTGSGQPNGIVNAAASGVTGVADPPTHDNLQDLIHSVDPAYRPNGKFMMHDSTLKSLKKIKVLQYSGDVVGLPLWQPGLTLGAPDTILGFPYVINQSMAVPGSTAKKIIFGDFSKFIIRDCRDVTLLRLDERFAELHQVAFLAFARSDSDLLDAGTNPVKYMAQT